MNVNVIIEPLDTGDDGALIPHPTLKPIRAVAEQIPARHPDGICLALPASSPAARQLMTAEENADHYRIQRPGRPGEYFVRGGYRTAGTAVRFYFAPIDVHD